MGAFTGDQRVSSFSYCVTTGSVKAVLDFERTGRNCHVTVEHSKNPRSFCLRFPFFAYISIDVQHIDFLLTEGLSIFCGNARIHSGRHLEMNRSSGAVRTTSCTDGVASRLWLCDRRRRAIMSPCRQCVAPPIRTASHSSPVLRFISRWRPQYTFHFLGIHAGRFLGTNGNTVV